MTFKKEHNEHCKEIAKNIEDYANGNVYKCPQCGDEIDDTREFDDDGNIINVDDDHDESGAMRCPTCGEWMQFDDWTADDYAEQCSLFDYFSDAFDFRVTRSGLDRDGDIIGVEILIAFGGPNIWVDTCDQAVKLFWWGDRGEASIPGYVCEAIDNEINELCY